jgi:hypothetical protein
MSRDIRESRGSMRRILSEPDKAAFDKARVMKLTPA